MAGEILSVSVKVPLLPERAWALYTDPAAITRWNFASDDWHCPSAQIDLVVGGAHTARMEAKDGSFGFDLTGSYTEVDAPKALTLELSDGRMSRTTFTQVSGGTVVETRFEVESQNSAELQRQGWQAILDNYRRLAESVAAP